MRRFRAAAVGAATLSLALTASACGGGSTTGGEGSNDSPKTLTYWASNQGPNVEADKKILKPELAKFEKQTGIKVKLEVIPWSELLSRILTATTSGQGPDVLNIGNTWSASLQASGALLPWDEKNFKKIGGKDRFVESALASAGAPDKDPAAVPLYSMAYALYYNKKMFKEAGIEKPPATWDELVADGKKLAKDDKWALGAEGSNLSNNIHQVFALGKQHGADFFTADGKADFTSDGAVAAVKQYVDMMAKDKIIAPGNAEYSKNQSLSDFAKDKTAMVLWQAAATTFKSQGMSDDDWGVAPVPVASGTPGQGKATNSMVAGINMAVFKNTKNIDGSLKFVKFMTSEAEQKILCASYGSVPPVKAAQEDAAFDRPELKVLRDTLAESAAPLPQVANESQFVFDGLLTHDADMKLKPALAAELPKVGDDGKTYTFTLREGVKFSDGKPFTSKDVVFTYETILDKKTNNAAKTELDAVKDVEAKGDDTVVFHLKYPYAPFAERTVLPIAPEHIAGKQDVNTGEFTTKPVGTGPYELVKWSKGEKLTFKANPGYWGGAPKVKNFTMAIIKDDDIRATRLDAGELDGAILPPNLAKKYESDGNKKSYAAKTFDYRVVTLPTGNKVTGDTDIRRALDTGVDRKAMVDSILDGAGKEAYGPVPTDSPWFTKGTERKFDADKAKKILSDAGWKPGKDGIREKDGVRATFPLWYLSGDKLRQDHALAYASDAKKLGIKVEVQAGTWEVIEPRMPKDAVLAGGGSPADPDFDQYTLLKSSLAGDGFNNMAHYDNPKVDKALDEARESGDHAKRQAAYDTIQRELVKNPGYTFLTHIDHLYVVDKRFGDLTTQTEPHDHGLASGPWWNVEDWQPKQ